MSIAGEDVERFRAIVGDLLGLALDDGRAVAAAELLRRRSALGRGVSRYLDRLAASAEPEELRVLARELTVGESYFFRCMEQFRVLREVVLPDLLRRRPDRRPIRVLSAGCAGGEEPYSVAITALEASAGREPGVSILGVDVNREAITRAKRGCYSAWALRETSKETELRWFLDLGRERRLDEAVRRLVTVEEGNLADPGAPSWGDALYEVIFCRNVLMYFTPEGAAALVERLTRCLVPGGYLFLGHAETLRGLSVEYDLCHTLGAFYYQRRGAPRSRPSGPAADPPPPRPQRHEAGAADAAQTPLDTDWVNAIRGAAARIEALAGASTASGPGPNSGLREELTLTRELLHQERFVEALATLRSKPREGGDSEAVLLEAVLLAIRGELGAAEAACRRLLALDSLDASAHYVLALCRAGTGDAAAAVYHDQAAAHLDPRFAMPVLHLGLMARRAGDVETARRELGRAAALLEREDSSRLLLFGGGFKREALVSLCRAELAACGVGA